MKDVAEVRREQNSWSNWMQRHELERTDGSQARSDEYLLQLGESQGVVVFDLELHEAHVGRVGELGDDAEGWEQSGEERGRPRERVREIERMRDRASLTWRR